MKQGPDLDGEESGEDGPSEDTRFRQSRGCGRQASAHRRAFHGELSQITTLRQEGAQNVPGPLQTREVKV